MSNSQAWPPLQGHAAVLDKDTGFSRQSTQEPEGASGEAFRRELRSTFLDKDTGFSRQSTQEPESASGEALRRELRSAFLDKDTGFSRQSTQEPESASEQALRRELHGGVLSGLEHAPAGGALEKILHEIAQQGDGPAGQEQPQSQSELAAFKSELHAKVFGGLQRALDSGALEDAFKEVLEEAGDHSGSTVDEQSESPVEVVAFRSEVRSKFFSSVEQALDNGALEDVFREIADETGGVPVVPAQAW